MTTHITFREWALLQSGAIVRIHQNHCTLSLGRAEDGAKLFVMERRGQTHTLLCMCTDEVRLSEHWRGFVEGAR